MRFQYYFFAIGIFITVSLHAADYSGSPENYRQLLGNLKPGDKLVLQPGEYRAGLPVHHLVGTDTSPIVITGSDTEPKPVFTARAGHNTVSLLDSAHVVIRRLILDGKGLPVDAVKAEGHSHWTHHIVLENLEIRGHGYDQQTVGISTKCPSWSWIIRDNIISGAGTGVYLGDSDGDKPFVSGLIEYNLIYDSIGYDLQIKHQKKWPAIPELEKQAGGNAIIRHNVFSKAQRGSIDMARPNVLIGHQPRNGPGANGTYLIYGNIFYDNPTEALLQGEGNIALYNNLFINPHGDAIRIQPHHDVPRNLDIFSNTVVASGAGITIRNKIEVERFRQRVVGNALFATPALNGAEPNGNIVDAYEAAGRYLISPFAPVGALELFPRVDRLEIDELDLLPFRHYQDWNRDFNGILRRGRFAGAYAGQGRNAGWRFQLAPKPRPVDDR